MAILRPAPPWEKPQSEFITLWHGCTSHEKNLIEQSGIDLNKSRINLDFGRGFYTTTIKRQARQWAWVRFYDPSHSRRSANQPVVLRFQVSRHHLARQSSLHFVLGDYDSLGY